MIAFWMMTGLAAALAALLVLAGARRGADAAEGVEADAGRRELDELDRLKTRGLLDETAHAAARAEAGRRLLAQEKGVGAAPRAGSRDRLWVLVGTGAAVLGALGLYMTTASPGLPDQPYRQRVEQWASDPSVLEPEQLAAVMGRVATERPNDPRALAMLGAARFEAGDPIGAASAFRRLLAVQPDDAQAWARLGESLVRAADGRVGADAEAAFAEALKRDPDQLGARFFLGEAALTRGDAATVRAMWGPLAAALDPADPRRQDLEQRMAALDAGAAPQ